MSIESPVGTLDIKNATLRVGKLEVSNIQGIDTALNVTRANSVLIYDDQASTTTFNGTTSSAGVRDTVNGYLDVSTGYVYWGQKLPNSWVMDFEMDIRSGTNAGSLYANVFSTTNTGGDGYSFTFNDSNDKITLKYDGTTLTESTVSGLFTASESWQKVVINYERGLIAISVGGSRKFYYKDIERETPYTTGEYISFSSASTDGRKIRDLRIVNGEKWVYAGESNVVYTQGSVGVGVTDPQYTLDVGGDINFTGTFYQGGSPFVSSLWTSGNDSLYYTASNVGIGTDTAEYTLDVHGNANVGALTTTSVSGDGSALYGIQSSNVSDFASNVTRIETLETDLSSNATRVSTLETDLGSNVTRIETLETDLSSNATRVSTLETDLGSNVTRIGTLETGNMTISGQKTFSGDVILQSNLHVQGDLLVANTVNMTVSDPILELGSNNLNTGDIGIVMTRHGAANSNVTVFFDETEDVLKLGYTLNGANDTTLEFDSNALAVSVQGALTAASVSGDGSGLSSIQSSNVSDFASNVTRIATLETDLTSNVGRIGTLETDLTSNVTRITNLESSDMTIGGEKTFSSNLQVGTADLFVNTTTGKVGVGTESPDGRLHICSGTSGDCHLILHADTDNNNETDNPKIMFRQDGGIYIAEIGIENSGNKLALRGTGGIAFYDGSPSSTDIDYIESTSTELMRITGGGNVGIGTAAPLEFLHVQYPNPSYGSGAVEHSNVVISSGAEYSDAGLFFRTPFDATSPPKCALIASGGSYSGCNGQLDICFDTTTSNGAAFRAKPSNAKVTFKADGNVGIGTTSPSHKLNVRATSGDAEVHIQAQGNDGGDAILYFNGANADQRKCAIISSNVAPNSWCKQDLYFCHNAYSNSDDVTIADSKMVITNNGRVGIGTTSPGTLLDVVGHPHTFIRKMAQAGTATNDYNHILGGPRPGTTSAGAVHFINGSARTSDGGTDTYTIRNDSGRLRLGNASFDTLLEGNVGIGTESPATDFHVGVGDANIRIGAINYSGSAADTTTYGLERSRNQILFSTWRDAQTDKIGAKICGINKQTYASPGLRHLIQSTDLAFYTVPPDSASYDGTVERLRITDTGNVGIGTTSPDAPLVVASTRNADTWAADKSQFDVLNDNGSGSFYGMSFAVSQTRGDGIIQTFNRTAGTANYNLCLQPNGGNVGIGTTNPVAKLHVNGDMRVGSSTNYMNFGSDGVMYHGTRMNSSTETRFIYLGMRNTTGTSYYMVNAGSSSSAVSWDGYPGVWSSANGEYRIHGNGPSTTCAVRADGGHLTFTGSHDTFTPFSEEDVGKIVCSTGEYSTELKNGVMYNELTVMDSCPIVTLATKDNDKRVMGVLSRRTTRVETERISEEEYDALPNKTNYEKLPSESNVYTRDVDTGEFSRGCYNAVGEGGIWVTNKNGVFENGDYIVSSTIPGYGQKQNDDLLHNFTVAKITSDCDFTDIQVIKQRHTSVDGIYQYNENGEPIRENVLDENGNTITFSKFKLRYLLPDGTQITKEEYALAAEAYIAAFVGCTYHCG